jgi:hypothetical protein
MQEGHVQCEGSCEEALKHAAGVIGLKSDMSPPSCCARVGARVCSGCK